MVRVGALPFATLLTVTAYLAQAIPTNDNLPPLRSTDLQPGEEYGDPCMLDICTLKGADAPRLYVLETFDGVGHRLANMLNGIALAYQYGMSFGGIVRATCSKGVSQHGVDLGALLDGMFGPSSAEELVFREAGFKTRDPAYFALKLHTPWTQEFRDDEAFMQRTVEFGAGDNIYVPIAELQTRDSLAYYFPEEVQDTFKAGLAKKPLMFDSGRPSVAIHVRRGDLPRGSERATADTYYFRLIHAIRELEPNADIHVWSSTMGPRGAVWKSEDFDGFRKRGIQVHLDDEDILEPWAHMAHADIFVTSLSYFSYTPGVLNSKCVVYPGAVIYPEHHAEPPSNWINALEIEGLKASSDPVPQNRDGLDGGNRPPTEGDSAERRAPDDDTADASGDATSFKQNLRGCLDRNGWDTSNEF